MRKTRNADRDPRFEEMWDKCRPLVLAYCMRRTSAHDAEDACSETFLVAWRRLDDVPDQPRTILYLYGIAGKVLSNQKRSVHRRTRLDERLSRLGVTQPIDPGVLVVQNTEDEVVMSAVRRLQPKDREIIMLDAWEELSRHDIAEVMGMTRSAVDQRIHRAYKRLARSLEPMIEIHPTNSPPVAEQGGT